MAKASSARLKKKKDKAKRKASPIRVTKSRKPIREPRPSRQKQARGGRGSAYIGQPDEPPNSRGLPALPDELLLEILSYFPPIMPKPSHDEDRWVRGSGFGRRSALVALSLLCSNLRRFFMPYIFETIEVYTGTIVDCGVRKAPLFLGGALNSYVVNKQFATELLRQLDIVTQRQPVLKAMVKTVSVELRDFKPQEVAEELVRCLPMFPNLRAIRLKVMFPLQKAHLPTAHLHFNPSVFESISLPSVETALVCHLSLSLLKACPHVTSVWGFGLGIQDEHVLRATTLRHCQSVETLFIRRTWHQGIMDFKNLRHLIIKDTSARDENAIMSSNMVFFLRYPNFPRLKSIHAIVPGPLNRKTFKIDCIEEIVCQLLLRQSLNKEDKSFFVEYLMPSAALPCVYITLKQDRTHSTRVMSTDEYYSSYN